MQTITGTTADGLTARVRRGFSNFPAASFFFSAAFFVVFATVFQPGYAVNDDIKMIALLTGYPAASPAPFTVFSNVLLGIALVPLYQAAATVNWAILLFLLLQFISIWAMLTLILRSDVVPSRKRLGVAVVLMAEAYFALNITFTTTAAVACTGGSCLLLSFARSTGQRRLAQLLGGALLIFVGSLIRFEMALLAASLALSAVVMARSTFDVRRTATAALAGGLLVGAGYVCNLAYVRASPEWNAFDHYNYARSLIQDTHRRENLGRMIRRVGWSPNDQELFVRWYLPEEGTYALDKLQYLNEHVSPYSADLGYTLMTIVQFPFAPAMVPPLLMMLAMGAQLYSEGVLRPSILVVLALVAIAGAEIVYFAWAWKIADRVVLSLLSMTVVFSLFVPLWQQVQPKSPGGARGGASRSGLDFAAIAVTGVAAMVLVSQSLSTSASNLQERRLYDQIRTDLARLQETGAIAPGALIVSPGHGVPLEWADPLKVEFPSVNYLDMNWQTFSPAYYQVLSAFHIDDLATALYARPDVYLMTRSNIVPYIARSYAEHRGVEVRFRSLYAMPNPPAIAGYEDVHLYKVLRLR